jgi:N-acetylglucosaminyldiphosphoundecaprenol N-acetyl-beta-D-mannosaminyltransferase
VSILGIDVDNYTMQEALDELCTNLAAGKRRRVAFVNADCLNLSVGRPAYRAALSSCDRVLADGVGLSIAGKLLRQPIADNVNGTDLFPLLCERLVSTGHSLFLLGARPGVARAAAESMQRRFPGLVVAGTHHGYFPSEEEGSVIDHINRSGANVLLVALGAPRQELWLERHQDDLRPELLMGVGGLFDFYSGRVPRAPLGIRRAGIEWVWRLLQEPSRLWRRYLLGNPLFLLRILRQRAISSAAIEAELPTT